MTLDEIQAHEGRFAVEGYSGIAFRFAGAQTEMQVGDYQGEYYPWDSILVETGMVYMIMVGDDHKHVIDPADVTPLDDNAYCHVCGQIGCTHDGR